MRLHPATLTTGARIRFHLSITAMGIVVTAGKFVLGSGPQAFLFAGPKNLLKTHHRALKIGNVNFKQLIIH